MVREAAKAVWRAVMRGTVTAVLRAVWWARARARAAVRVERTER